MKYFFCLFLFLSLLFVFSPSTDGAAIGVCYGRVADDLPSTSTVTAILQYNSIFMARVFKPEPDVLRTFSGSGIELMVGVPNEALPLIANNTPEYSFQWLQANIFSYISPTQIKYLAVGNEVFLKDEYYTPYVVPAIYKLHQALNSLNLDQIIKISSPHAANVLASSYPPSNGSFDPTITEQMVALLQFLQDTNSPLMVNVYPFFSYINNQKDISLDYALFNNTKNATVDNGLYYDNLYDATLDAFVAAMEKVGFGGVRLLVSETGWPTAGGDSATLEKASAYNGNVVSRALGNVGTPRRPGDEVEVFLFDMFDEDEKTGQEYEKHFGVFRLNGDKAYEVNFRLPVP